MKLTIKQAVKIYTSRKDFLIYTLDNENKIDNFTLSNDLTRHRKVYGKNTKFLLTDIIKPKIKQLTINL